ncbi:MAG TPA: SDR family oxidoreductase [Solirubrobacteraceae bacterium]|jgi:NAD(P)-dependent dehydrogenase (short-subunit alcohol dehydrogenase family)|nr:SDR family oxidoreductase [Solirubrobacteraceae bacterium]
MSGQLSGALSGRTALITGASRGLGLEIARAYLDADAAGICICGRDRDALEDALTELRARAKDGQIVIGDVADVSEPEDVERLVELALGELGEIVVLVSNAGIYGPKGGIAQTDWAQWRRAVEINLFGSVLPVRRLLEHFTARRSGKIVQLSGGGATSPMPALSAYAASKAAVVRFTETLAEELREHHVDVNALAPGALNTRMLDELLGAGPQLLGQAVYERALAQQQSGGSPPEQAASLAVFLGSAASDGITGKLLSAVWDPWAELPEHLDELRSDVYTLRRIVPADRRMEWGDA